MKQMTQNSKMQIPVKRKVEKVKRTQKTLKMEKQVPTGQEGTMMDKETMGHKMEDRVISQKQTRVMVMVVIVAR